MKAKDYFDKEYELYHIEDVISTQDVDSLYALMEEYAKAYHQSKVNNVALDDVSKLFENKTIQRIRDSLTNAEARRIMKMSLLK
jgi:hypothetical protein